MVFLEEFFVNVNFEKKSVGKQKEHAELPIMQRFTECYFYFAASRMALPVAAIVSIVFGVWALLVLIIFAIYQFLKVSF